MLSPIGGRIHRPTPERATPPSIALAFTESA